MLGRLRMNIDDCIEDYGTLGEKVFGHSRWFHVRTPLFFWFRDKYNHEILENVVRGVVRERVPKAANFPGGQKFAYDENRCRAYVSWTNRIECSLTFLSVVISYQTAQQGDYELPYLFRTYKNLHKGASPIARLLDRNPGLAHDIPIWQVARATSAAPTYFKAMKIDGIEYVDGGLGSNNPCEEIYDEVRKMNNNSDKCVSIMLSIGTGKNYHTSRVKGTGILRYLHLYDFAMKRTTGFEVNDAGMRNKQNYSQHQFKYFRLNVESGPEGVKLDEWRARGRLRTAIGRFIGGLRLMKQHPKRMANSADDTSYEPKETVANKERKIPEWLQSHNKTLDSIRLHTRTCLDNPVVKDWITDAATFLVNSRRLRAKTDPERWERTFYGIFYK